jgi:2EXR family
MYTGKDSPTKAESPEVSSVVNSPIDSKRLSPATDASPDPYDDPNYVNPKWPKDPPKLWKPHLEKFTLFSKLPIEMRQAIWKFTLKPRVVEVSHNSTHGFYSRVKCPVALKVNRDSRNAVSLLYPLCFGNVLHQPNIVFNFSIDTLYFDADSSLDVPQFLISLKNTELKQIQSIAVDRFIDEIREWDEYGYNPYNNMEIFKKVAASMSALGEFLVVYKLDEIWHDHGFPDGAAPMQLYEEFPWQVQHHMFNEEYHLDDEDGESECQELPNFDHLLAGFDVPKRGSIWGWRPMNYL